MHHGIKGQRWGVRRYQNRDGSLTNAGKKRISKSRQILDARKDLKENGEKYEKAIKKARSEYEKKNDWYHINGVHIDDTMNLTQEEYWKLEEKQDHEFRKLQGMEQKYRDLKALAETKTGKEKALKALGGVAGTTLAVTAISFGHTYLPKLLRRIGG